MNNGPPSFLSRSPPPLDDCADDSVIETDEILSRLKNKNGLTERDENANSKTSATDIDGEIASVTKTSEDLRPELDSNERDASKSLDENVESQQNLNEFDAAFEANFADSEEQQISDNEDGGKDFEFATDFGAFGNDENVDGGDAGAGDWANFEVTADDAQAPCSSTDWSADFEERDFAEVTQHANKGIPALNDDDDDDDDDDALALARVSLELDQILCVSFGLELCVQFSNAQAIGLNSIIAEDNNNAETHCDEEKRKMDHCKLWLSLRSIEDSFALKYQFSESVAFQRYASALKMDIALAKLRRPNLPAFAWHLGATALTPEKASDSQSVSGGNVLQPSVDSRPSNTVNSNDNKSNKTNAEWSSSTGGLFNPLPNSSSFNYGALDLDVLIGNSQLTSSTSIGAAATTTTTTTTVDSQHLPSVIENELACSSAAPPGIPLNGNNNSILNKIAQQSFDVGSTVNSTSKREMSAEAINIVGNLPDLSFMLSPVLMFPVRDCDDNHN